MTAKDRKVLWIAWSLLSLAALLVGWVAWAGTTPETCGDPARILSLPTLAGADSSEPRDAAGRSGILMRAEAQWDWRRSEGTWSSAQVVISRDLSDFILHPFWLMPSLELPSDEVLLQTIDGEFEDAPAHLRINREYVSPFVAGWIYAFGGEPVASPVPLAIGRAFAHPLQPTPPIVMISAVSAQGVVSPETRAAVVERRLGAIWRDWEALCRR